MALPHPLQQYRSQLAAALAPCAGVEPAAIEQAFAEPPSPELGDVALAVHRFAKSAGRPPVELADEMATTAAGLDVVAAATAAGPFLNVRWDTTELARAVLDDVASATGRAGVLAGAEGQGRTAIVEYSSPNAARKLAFHHLRGTAVGAALARLYEARGWKVVRLNFLGDYGHNIGQLLVKLDQVPDGEAAAIPAERLQELYVEANRDQEADEAGMKAAAGEWLRRLNESDPVAQRRWKLIVDSTTAALDATYARIGVAFDEYRGESRYVASALEVASALVDAGVAQVDADGSVFVPETEGLQPVVLVTWAGRSTYEGRDAAAAIDRWEEFQPARSLYLTDLGQGGRFHAVFGALARAGYAWATDCIHVGFGVMQLGGKKSKTRKGDALPLDDVLDEAKERALEEIAARGLDIDDPDAAAEMVAVGSVLFGQTKMRRTSDFEFDLEAAVQFSGETGARMQYQHARICSILARAGTTVAAAVGTGDTTHLTDSRERQVVLSLAALPDAALRALTADDPSYVAGAVIAIADTWSAYQTAGKEDAALRVLSDDPAVRAARLRLAAATAVCLRDGLRILGVGAPERM